MNIVPASWSFESPVDQKAILELIERAGRVCYKSEGRIGDGTAEKFVRSILSRGHLSVIEHANISVRIVCDRGVTHEIVRHRIASYSQESTRYCNYGNENGGITVIDCGKHFKNPESIKVWMEAMENADRTYNQLISLGETPQIARNVLPNSLKTEMVMTCNLREWRHFFSLRTAKGAHPQMRELAQSMLEGFAAALPVFFGDMVKEPTKKYVYQAILSDGKEISGTIEAVNGTAAIQVIRNRGEFPTSIAEKKA